MLKIILIAKRIALVVVTVCIGFVFFLFINGYFKAFNKIDTSWESVENEYLTNDELKTGDTYIATVYANTDPSEYRLVWWENFDNKDLDFLKWSFVKKTNNDNNELQAYLAENVKVFDGILYLTAKKENYNNKAYTSGMIETFNKFSFKYGKIEFFASIPNGKGLFPAIWMLSEKGNYWEIDILESLGHDASLIYGVNHYKVSDKRLKTYSTIRINNPEDYHLYSLEWYPDKLIWAVDNKVYHKTSKGVPQENMYILLNLAVGGDWPGSPDKNTIFPSYMAIDYIRVYEFIEKDTATEVKLN